jgi:TonB family protein
VRPQVDVVALTHSDDFLLDLGDVLAGQATVRPVDTAAGAVELLWSSRRAQVLVVDARERGDVRAELAQALGQAPHALALVFAPEGEEAQTTATLQGLPIEAVLPIPVDRRKTALALDAAFADAALRAPGTRPTVADRAETLASVASIGAPPSGPRSKVALWVAATIATVGAAVTAAWYLKSPEPQQAAAAPAAAVVPVAAPAPSSTPGADDAAPGSQKLVETTLLQGKVDDLLEKARSAMRERHYTEPARDNALLYYRSAHAVDPGNAEANDGLQRIAGVLQSRFEDALTAGRLEEAASSLAGLQQAIPGDARLAGLELRLTEKQMARLLADNSLESATRLLQKQAGVLPAEQVAKYRQEITRRQEDTAIGRKADEVADAIREGRLEGDDGARALLQQLQTKAPNNPATQREARDLARDLNAAYLRRARDAKTAPEQDRWLQLARAGGLGPAEIEAVRREIIAAHQKALQAENDRVLGMVRERLRDGRLTEPAQDSAVFYLGQLQSADPNAPATLSASHELAGKLLDRARSSLNLGKTPLADADLALAKRYGADPKDISAVQAEATHTAAPSAAASPAHVSSAPAAAEVIVPKRLRYTPPDFPPKALAQNLSGSVTVTFVVDTNGDPRDIRVVEATPAGIFDHAAQTAVKRWHYQPTLVDGKPIEVTVQTTLRFAKPE